MDRVFLREINGSVLVTSVRGLSQSHFIGNILILKLLLCRSLFLFCLFLSRSFFCVESSRESTGCSFTASLKSTGQSCEGRGQNSPRHLPWLEVLFYTNRTILSLTIGSF